MLFDAVSGTGTGKSRLSRASPPWFLSVQSSVSTASPTWLFLSFRHWTHFECVIEKRSLLALLWHSCCTPLLALRWSNRPGALGPEPLTSSDEPVYGSRQGFQALWFSQDHLLKRSRGVYRRCRTRTADAELQFCKIAFCARRK